MGRAGAGGSGGGGSFGGHSSGRISGGHQVGGGRVGSGGFNSGGFSGGYSGGHYHYYSINRQSSPLAVVIFAIILLVIFAVDLFGNNSGVSIPKSTYNREKVNTGVAFQNDCIVDELGWFGNIPKTEKKLKKVFYDKTGIQPYIVLKGYDISLKTNEQKEAYARDYYEKNIDNEGTFLYMYFAEPVADQDVGYMCYVNGKQVTEVMDSEAVEIFWAYVDANWYSDMSTDDLFLTVFNKTASRIMKKTTTAKDIMFLVVILVIIVASVVGVIFIIKAKRKAEKEKAEETERILRTPLHSLSPDDDDLRDKYLRK